MALSQVPSLVMFRIPLFNLKSRYSDQTMSVGTVAVNFHYFRSNDVTSPFRNNVNPEDVVDTAQDHTGKALG
jgi:hypothetical protein